MIEIEANDFYILDQGRMHFICYEQSNFILDQFIIKYIDGWEWTEFRGEHPMYPLFPVENE